jgi:hypothetical protein
MLKKTKYAKKPPDAKHPDVASFEAEQQLAAFREILQIISRSPTDLTPVFDCILDHATRLCDAQPVQAFSVTGFKA